MSKHIAVAGFLLGFVLSGCGDDPAPKSDSEDYKGASQAIMAKRVDPAVMGMRTKSESYCAARNTNGTCKTHGTRVRTEPYVADDKDWVLILADGTEIDLDQHDWDRYQIGGMYP